MKIGRFNCKGGLSFRPELVPLILSGAKTQTRRFCPPGIFPDGEMPEILTRYLWRQERPGPPIREEVGGTVIPARHNTARLPFAPGDLVFLKEGIHRVCRGCEPFEVVGYSSEIRLAKSQYGDTPLWTAKPDKLPAMYMGARFARTILRIKAVRFERLGDMTDADAVAEGVVQKRLKQNIDSAYYIPLATGYYTTPLRAFAAYWNTLAKTRAERWEAMQGKLVRVIKFSVEATARNQYELLKGSK
jgi:hypothetical protein